MGKLHLGDYVRETETGYRGRVYRIDHSCCEDESWLAGQMHPFTPEQLKERWFGVLTANGGSIMSCESRLERVVKFDLNNNWEDYYFGDPVEDYEEAVQGLRQLDKELDASDCG